VAAWRLTPPQKIQSAKIRWKSSCLNFLGSRRHPPHLLFPKGQTIYMEFYSSQLVQLKDILKEKAMGRSPMGLFLARQWPSSPGTCKPEETGLPGLPISSSRILFSGSGPLGLPLFPELKKQLEGRHFSSDA